MAVDRADHADHAHAVLPLTLERQALEPVPDRQRHGRPGDGGWLWFAANLGLPPWSLGVLAVGLGLSPLAALAAVLVGNLVGAGLMAAVAMLGPESGLPAIVLTRTPFGAALNRLPSALNALSCLGWYAVNAVLGGEALALLAHVPLVWGLALLTVALAAVAAVGHDLVHRLERFAAYALAALFLFTGVRLFAAHAGPFAHSAATPGAGAGMFLLAVAIVASYLFSWAPYATDYARYLPAGVGRRPVFAATFLGAFASSAGVEVLGVLTALAVGSQGSPVAVLVRAMGAFAAPALAAVVLGTVTANALNVYTGGLSSLSAGLRLGRPAAAAAFALVGGAAAYVGAHGFDADYENFLLLISYWVAPWIGVVLALALGRGRAGAGALGRGALAGPAEAGTRRRLFTAFVAGLVATVPFMNQALYEGPVARLLGGGDVGYWAGLLVAFALARWAVRPRATAAATQDGDELTTAADSTDLA
jgi:NCS1 family nucleobase:cation symporter-1